MYDTLSGGKRTNVLCVQCADAPAADLRATIMPSLL